VRRAAVAGAMLATFQKAVKASDDFWGPVCDGVGLEKKNDPRWQLRNFLLTHNQSNVRTGDLVTAEDTYRICVNLWNHWRKGEEVSTVRTTDQRFKPL